MSEKIKLLIIDDEVDFLDAIAERLSLKGFDVTKASSGADALAAAKTKTYDIALLDLKMPGLNGFEVLKILKKDHAYIEVIILTAHGSQDAAFDTSKTGAFDFLTKPYDFDELISKITEAYKERLRKKIDPDIDLFNKIIEKYANVPFAAESGLDMLEELKKLDDERK